MKGDLGGAALELAGRRVVRRTRPFGEDDDVDTLREQALGLVERAGGIVVDEEYAPDDLRVEEVTLGRRFRDGGRLGEHGDENDDVD